jgi:hypothetical protein
MTFRKEVKTLESYVYDAVLEAKKKRRGQYECSWYDLPTESIKNIIVNLIKLDGDALFCIGENKMAQAIGHHLINMIIEPTKEAKEYMGTVLLQAVYDYYTKPMQEMVEFALEQQEVGLLN